MSPKKTPSSRINNLARTETLAFQTLHNGKHLYNSARRNPPPQLPMQTSHLSVLRVPMPKIWGLWGMVGRRASRFPPQTVDLEIRKERGDVLTSGSA